MAKHQINPFVKGFHLENARLLQTLKPMVGHQEMINNLEMQIPQSMIMNGGSDGVRILERYRNEDVRIMQLAFLTHGFIPKHHHPHWCVVKVLSGVIVDTVNDIVIDSGDIFIYQPGQFHNAIATQNSEVLVFNTVSEPTAYDILNKKDYFFKGKKASYQLYPIEKLIPASVLI